jgi:signal transduction histidine kinase
VLDNAINGEPIRHKEIKLASLCGLVAGNFIYQALLHRRMVDMERLAALGEMASFMTHQLRNPVTAIGGFADQLLNGPRDEAHLRRNLEIIRGEIRRLETLLFKLAHFLKADLCGPLPFDLLSIVRSVLESGEVRRRAAAYEVTLDWAEESSPVLGDATAVGEAIRNLVDNAFDATAPGGRVEIRGGRLNRLWTMLEVRDTGRGLTPEARRNLFSPFFTTKGEGLGLGLLFVKRVLDACGGRVEVESEAGKGTLFRLTFRNAQEGRTEP